MPIDNNTQSRIEGIRRMAGGAPRTPAPSNTAPAVGNVPAPGVSNPAPKKTPLQVSYPNLTDDDMENLFTEDGVKDFKYLMNGMDAWAKKQLLENPKYSQSKQYFLAAKKSAVEIANYYTANKDKWTDKSIAELERMRKDYFTKQTIAQRSLVAFIDKKEADKLTKEGIKEGYDLRKLGKEHAEVKMLWDPEEGKIVTRKYMDEKNEEVFRSEKFYSDLKTYKDDPWYVDVGNFLKKIGPGNWIDNAMDNSDDEDMLVKQKIAENYGYTTFMKESGRRPPELEWKLNYMLKNWSKESITLMNKAHKDSFGGKVSDYYKNINNTMRFVYDVLDAGQKSKNADVQKLTKELREGLRKNSDSWSDKVEFIRQNGSYVYDIINNKEFGYYSKVALFQKHKDVFNHSRYIGDDAGQKLSQTQKGQRIDRIYGEVDMMLKNIENQKKDFRALKDKYRNELKAETPEERFFRDNMFNKAGDVISVSDFYYKKVPADGTKSPLFTDNVKKYIEVYNQHLWEPGVPRKNQIPNYRHAGIMAQRAVGEKGYAEFNLFSKFYGTNPDNENFGKRHKTVNPNLKESYNAYKNQYKQKFNEFEASSHFKYSAMAAGFGAKGFYELEQREINFAKMNSKKAVNASNLITNVGKALKDNNAAIYVKDGAWSHLDSITDMQDEDNAANFKKVFDGFFKDKESANFNLRYVNAYKDKGFVIYTFENLKTNKELSIAMPKSYARGIGDEFASAAYDDSDDFHFDMVGEKKLTNLAGDLKHIRNPRIYYDKGSGQKVFDAEIDFWNEDQKKFVPQQRKIPLGDTGYVTIDDATRTALTWIKQYEQSLQD